MWNTSSENSWASVLRSSPSKSAVATWRPIDVLRPIPTGKTCSGWSLRQSKQLMISGLARVAFGYLPKTALTARIDLEHANRESLCPLPSVLLQSTLIPTGSRSRRKCLYDYWIKSVPWLVFCCSNTILQTGEILSHRSLFDLWFRNVGIPKLWLQHEARALYHNMMKRPARIRETEERAVQTHLSNQDLSPRIMALTHSWGRRTCDIIIT